MNKIINNFSLQAEERGSFGGAGDDRQRPSVARSDMGHVQLNASKFDPDQLPGSLLVGL
jgi:hypothetical protein